MTNCSKPVGMWYIFPLWNATLVIHLTLCLCRSVSRTLWQVYSVFIPMLCHVHCQWVRTFPRYCSYFPNTLTFLYVYNYSFTKWNKKVLQNNCGSLCSGHNKILIYNYQCKCKLIFASFVSWIFQNSTFNFNL